MSNIDVTHTQMWTKMITPSFTFYENKINPYAVQFAGTPTTLSLVHLQLVQMNLGETLTTSFAVADGLKSITINGTLIPQITTAICGLYDT